MTPKIPKIQKVGLNPHQDIDFIGIFFEVVPGGGIEPPTRGFSIHCSTPELPGHGKRERFG